MVGAKLGAKVDVAVNGPAMLVSVAGGRKGQHARAAVGIGVAKMQDQVCVVHTGPSRRDRRHIVGLRVEHTLPQMLLYKYRTEGKKEKKTTGTRLRKGGTADLHVCARRRVELP